MRTRAEDAAPALAYGQREKLLRPVQMPRWQTLLAIAIVLGLIVWSATGTELSVQKFVRGIPRFIEFFGQLWPPDRAYWRKMLSPIAITLQMAVLGTLLAMILSFPVGLLAANNTSPHPSIYQATRFLLNVVRSIAPLVWAVIIVAAVGFGPFAGVLALGIGGIGTLGKLYAEAIEAISPRPIEALRATGSGSLPIFTFAVLPQALPLLISYTLLDFESNLRSATILGIVGAGGIGFELQASFEQFRFHQVSTILFEIIIVVTVIDRISAFVRKKVT